MKAIPLMIVLIALGTGALAAQSGAWTRPGTWHMAQSHRVVEFNGSMWAVGGANLNSDYHTFAEVRSSTDGVNWTQEVAQAPFGPRANHGLVVFNNRLWVLGGSSTPLFGLLGDVWSSPDGVNWTLETDTPGWSARASHATVVHDNQIWVMGGRTPSHSSDVWSSYDGVNWTQHISSAPWHGRYEHASAAFQGRIWVFGGQSGTAGETNDVWSSADGLNWTLGTSSAAWAKRSAHTVVEMNGKLWLMGGGWSFHKDVWESSDGVNWTPVTTSPAWNERRAHASVAYNGRLWVFGGYFETAGLSPYWLLRRDIWSSADGVSWQFETEGPNWSPRYNANVVSFNNRLWVVGGGKSDYTAPPDSVWFEQTSEVWSSPDGADWTLETVAPFSPRLGHGLVVFNGQMWVIGGGDSIGTNDVWSSTDGVQWVQQTGAAQWSPREGLAAVVFDNRMWIMGGHWMGLEYHDVWSSVDGINWRKATSQPGWSRRRYPNVVEFNNRMWVIGGVKTEAPGPGMAPELTPCTDIWSTADGDNWTQEVANATFLQRAWPAVTVFENRIWMTGGYWYQGLNDVWNTSDGVNWQTMGNSPWPGRSFHSSTVHDGKLWIVGGGWHGDPFNDAWAFEPDNPPQITSTPPATAVVGQSFSYSITVSGVPAPTLTVTGLPGWMTFNGSTLSGTPGPNDVGLTGTITVQADNTYGSDVQTFQLDVVGGAMITSAPAVTAVAGTGYSYTVVVSGVQPISIVASGLPGWLTLNGDTLSGTPTEPDIGLSGTITIEVSNVYGSDTQDFQINIEGQPPAFTSTSVTDADVGTPYLYQVSASGIPAATLSAATLPPWLQFDPVSGELYGTPPVSAGDTSVMVELTASNGWGPDATQTFTLTIHTDVSRARDAAAGCRAGTSLSPWWLALPMALLLLRRRRSRA